MTTTPKVCSIKRDAELITIIQKKCSDSQKAINKLVSLYHRLILKEAHSFSKRCRSKHLYTSSSTSKTRFPLEDFYNIGVEGLLKAIYKFDVKKGAPLVEYARWYIKNELHEYNLTNHSITKTNRSKDYRNGFNNLKKAIKSLKLENKDQINDNDFSNIANLIGISSVKRCKEIYLSLNQNNISTTNYNSEGEEYDLIDNIHKEIDSSYFDVSPIDNNLLDSLIDKEENKIKTNKLYLIINNLSEKEKVIITGRRLRANPITLSTLSKQLNLSMERVRQIENIVIDKIKNSFCNQLSPFKKSA